MNLPTQYCAIEPFDFRSPLFRDTALMLVQTTGCSLVLCRQELFIAEGDTELAYGALMARRASADVEQLAH